MANSLTLMGAGSSAGTTAAAPVAACSVFGEIVDGEPFEPTNETTGAVTSWLWERSTDGESGAAFTANSTQQNPSLDSAEYGFGGAGGTAYIRVTATGPGGSDTSDWEEFELLPSG